MTEVIVIDDDMIGLDLTKIDNHIDVIREIDARNARCRAAWTQKFYTGAKCFDVWAMDDRARFENHTRVKLGRARRWINRQAPRCSKTRMGDQYPHADLVH